MPSDEQEVPVYHFRALDQGWESAPVSSFKATREAVQKIFAGEIIECTEERVPREALDELGRYRRIATGWGALD